MGRGQGCQSGCEAAYAAFDQAIANTFSTAFGTVAAGLEVASVMGDSLQATGAFAPEGLLISKAAMGAVAGIQAVRANNAFAKASAAFAKIPKSGIEQVTSGVDGAEHAARSEKLAREIVTEIGAENVASIHYNQKLSTNFETASQNRPDVLVQLKDGSVVTGEVASGSQTIQSQTRKAASDAALTGRPVAGSRVDGTMAKDSASSSQRSVGTGASSTSAFPDRNPHP